jgi:hypothetical protein
MIAKELQDQTLSLNLIDKIRLVEMLLDSLENPIRKSKRLGWWNLKEDMLLTRGGKFRARLWMR